MRGQITRLISQADANYGIRYKDMSFVPRRDGLLLQVTGENDYYGYGNEIDGGGPGRGRTRRDHDRVAVSGTTTGDSSCDA